ncbi:MAG: haloacid dehalogenase-like hydrolase [Candidatus Hydrogenedentes bacterium]|nr:haloacid dehalogenase-like hydrolase [Candidatus Hydrogenedentota bacterium]
MGKPTKPRLAICYDFDGTLAAGNMQEYDYFPQLGIRPKDFWQDARERAKKYGGDEILSYMCLMLEKANMNPESGVKITEKAFAEYAKDVPLFKGVEDWFKRINAYAKESDLVIEHYIISSGIREMIMGTSIARQFKKIYASAFQYEQHGVAKWPILAINYTTKTQFLFRINKGQLDEWDNTAINAFLAKEARPVPFERMIYIGDGSTDVPCMRLVKDQGGHSIAVYKPKSKQAKQTAQRLHEEGRVNFVAPADYSENKELDKVVKLIVNKIAADTRIQKVARFSKKAIGKGKQGETNKAAITTELSEIEDVSISLLPEER